MNPTGLWGSFLVAPQRNLIQPIDQAVSETGGALSRYDAGSAQRERLFSVNLVNLDGALRSIQR